MANNRATKPVGFSIYQDEKGRYIYYDRLSGKAYQVLKSDFKKFNVLSTRIITSIAIGYLTYAISNIIWIGIVVGLAVYIAMLIAFRKIFINGTTYVDGFKPSKNESFITKAAKRVSKVKCIALIILLFALSILSIININTQEYELTILVLNYVLAIGSFGFGILYCVVLSHINKQ